MKLNLDKNGKEYLNSLLETKQININIADMLLELFLSPNAIQKKKMELLKRQFDEKEAFYSLALEYLGINGEDEEDGALAEEYIFQNIEKCDTKEYQNNQYAKMVTPKAGKYGKYEVEYLAYSPYQLFSRNEIRVLDDCFKEMSPVGFFDQKFTYLALSKNKEIWMSLNPNEINTMKPFIEKGNGNTLVLGLGMGYVPFMMSLKDDVKSITIVEKDPSIIHIFKNVLFPYFPNKEKIRIIQDDALQYVEKTTTKYDYIFADLWHTPEDGLPLFVRLKKIEKKKGIQMDYWLNESLHAMVRRCLLTLFEEATMDFKDAQYKNANNDFDKLINELYFKLKNVEFNTVEDIKTILSNDKINELITQ